MQSFSLSNVFWYYLGYGAVTFLVMRFMPLEKRKKILTYTLEGSFTEKLFAAVSLISRYGMIAAALFIPLSTNKSLILSGNLLYLAGLVLATAAMWQFSQAATNRPITWGLYKISRNPMQVMGFIMCIGIALAANNILLWFMTAINTVSSYPMFLMQERYCLQKYGREYALYMQKAPRILLLKSRNCPPAGH